MAVLALSILALVAVCVCEGIQGSDSGNFPLHGCSTEKVDILLLYFDSVVSTSVYGNQKKAGYDFADGLRSTEATSRAMIADVYDTYSTKNPEVNISSWKFYNLSTYVKDAKEELFGTSGILISIFNIKPYKKYHYSPNNNLTHKIQFVQRLFAEMAGSRENATHVAVIFLNGIDLSFEETRSIPHIVDQQKQDTDIKIFVVVFDVKYVSHVVYLRDTLLVGYNSKAWLGQILLVAICDQCSERWFLYRQAHGISCYLPLAFNSEEDWETGRDKCNYKYSSLTTIETKEEMLFLQQKMSTFLSGSKYLRYDTKNTSRLTVHFVIGLKKTTMNIGKRFHWYGEITNKYSPLVVNHWLLGKPSGDYFNGCGVWQFVYNNNSNGVSNTSGNVVVDGWVDVSCRDKVSMLSLCEATLPRRVEYKNIMRMKPASNESFTQALTKGDFMIFRDNIVSVSANIANKDFLGFLRKSEQELFPLFDCGEDSLYSQYISYVYVCDFIDHCSNRRDELFCFDKSQDTDSDRQNGVYCCDNSFLPEQWVGDGEVDCKVFGYSLEKDINDESDVVVNSFKTGDDCTLYCDFKCVSFKDLNNNKIDCHGKEGHIDETIGKLETTNSCNSSLGHRLWSPKCVYLKDMYGVLVGCRDVSHLDNCTDFQCPEGYVKCVNTYCIPQHYVFDGTLDCPTGDDENNYTLNSCTGNFACWNSKMCLHPDLVCDGHPDCPHRDDEVDCQVKCVQGSRCISGTVTVSDYNKLITTHNIYSFDETSRYMDLSHVELSGALFYYLSKVVVFIVSHCNLTSKGIYKQFLPNGLQILDISSNRLQTLDGHEIYDSPLDNVRLLNLSHNKEFVEIKNMQLILLETIDLSHTSLSLLNKSFVLMFPGLKHLNLSFTKIRSIKENTFLHNIIYQSIDLRGLFIVDFYEDYFNGLSISHDLFTDSFQLCCPQIRGKLIPYHTCHAPDDAISSCFDLIGIDVQRVLLWVVSVLAVLGNITVIGYRVIWDRSVLTTGYGLFVTNLGISDFIMGVYLFIIAGAGYYYRDIYVLYDKSWRESGVCKLAGFLGTLSSETSTFFVFLITLDKFLIMKFPFGQVKFSKMSKIIVLCLSWIIGFLLALTPIVFKFEIYSSNAMCLGLPLTTKRLSGWEFSFAVFIALKVSLVLLIAYGQRSIFRAMSENRMNHTSSRRANDLTVAKQLFLVALSNFFCWFPVGIMGLLTLGGHVISNDAYAWTTVIVLPINSAANPLLYTIPAIMAKWEKFKHGDSRAIKTST